MEFPRLQSRVSSSSSSSSVPPHKTQLHPRMQPFSLSTQNSKANKNPHRFLLLFISISLLPFLFYLFSLYRSIHLSSKFTPPASRVYGLILHIGSSRSQIRVFQTLDLGSGTPVLGDGSDSFQIPNGLSGLAGDPGGAERLLLELIAFAKLKVPKFEWRNTVVQLTVSDDGDADEVLEECRLVLRESGFRFKNDRASVLIAIDKASYAWVALNYVLGSLGNEPEDTYGIVGLDGSSVQITNAVREPEQMELSRTIRLAGVTYRLYTQSLPQFSQEAAWKTLLGIQNSQVSVDEERPASNPCMPSGYEKEVIASDGKVLQLHATGNFSACRIEVLKLLNRSNGECESPTCKEPLADLKEHTGAQRGFYYVSEFLGPHPMGSLSELETAGRHFCEDSWDILKSQHHEIDYVDLSRYCFSHAYAVALLHDNLGILDKSKRARLKSPPFDWTLGAFINLMTAESLEKLRAGDELRDQIVGNESVTYFFMFAVLLVGVLLAAFFVMKLRKPQMKTVYDLEKGQYIVTRLPR